MPQIGPAIAAWAAANAGTIAVMKAVLTAVMIVNGVMQARRARKAARAAYEASLRDRTVVIRSADAARTIVLGRSPASGPLVYACESGTYSEYLHLVIALGGHEFDAIEDVVFGDESIGALDASGYVTAGRYYKTRTEPGYLSATIPAGLTVTLPVTPNAVSSVVRDGGDNGPIAVSYSRAGAVLTFAAGTVGTVVSISYTYIVNTPLVRVKRFLGIAAGERDTDLETASGGQWTANHLGKGVPRLHVTMQYDQDAFPSGIPNIYAIVRGAKLYDPRTTGTEWSSNSALAARWYLTNTLGFGEPASAINDALVIAAANVCDENVSLAVGTQDRYTCDGSISTEDDRAENLGLILASMVGTAAYSGGQWLVRAGAYATPSLDLTDSDLADGPIEVVSALPRRDLFNAVRGRFADPEQFYAVVDFPPYASATYATVDNGEVIYRDIVLPLTNDVHRAQRIAKLHLHRSRQAMTIAATWKVKAQRLQPGDTCRLTIAHLGWSNKVFRVVDRRLIQPGTVQMTLQEEASTVYSWSYNEATDPDPAPNTNLPATWFVEALDNLTIASGASYYRTLSDGSRQAVMRVSWDASTDIGVRQGGRIEIYVKRAIAAEYQRIESEGDATTIDYDVANGEIYNVAIRARNGAQSRSNYTFATHTVTGAPTNTVSTGSITADRLAGLIHHSMSITPDPGFEDLTAWIFEGATPTRQSSGTTGKFGRYQLRGEGASCYAYTKPMPIDRSKRYRATLWAVSDGGTRLMYPSVVFWAANGNQIYGNSDPSGWPGYGLFHYFGSPGTTPPGAWTEYSTTFGAGETRGIPTDAVSVSVGALVHFDDSTSRTGYNWIGGPRIQQLHNTELLQANAATEVLFSSNTGGTLASGPGANNVIPCSVTHTNDTDGDVVLAVTAQGLVGVYFGGVDNPSYANAVISAGSMKSPLFSQVVRCGETTSGGRIEAFALADRGVLAPGASATVDLKIFRVNRTNPGPTEYAQLDYSACALRVEVIKK